MNNGPIDFDSPLGISKREWTKVLGINLALLLLVYAIALVCTLCGSNLFLLNFHSDDLQRIEDTLRNWNIFPLVQMAFSTIEEVIILAYTLKEKPKWWWIAIHFSAYVGLNFLMMATIGYVPSFVPLILGITMAVVLSVISHFKKKQKLYKCILRLLIVGAISLALNELIGLFRTKMLGIGAGRHGIILQDSQGVPDGQGCARGEGVPLLQGNEMTNRAGQPAFFFDCPLTMTCTRAYALEKSFIWAL